MKFIQDLRIPGYMTDVNHLLRPVSFMDLAQQIAIEGTLERGYGDDTLIRKHNAVWILARMKAVFDKMPSIMDKVELQTWHRGLDSLIFLRDYKMVSQSGETLVRSTSSWITMDIGTRRMLRTGTLTDVIPEEAEDNECALDSDAAKIILPDGVSLEKVWEHRVEYSDTDYNHHANNAKYTQWITDALPQDLVFNNRMKSIEINFNKEVHPSEVVEFFLASDGEMHYIEGRCNDMQVFISKIEFTSLQQA